MTLLSRRVPAGICLCSIGLYVPYIAAVEICIMWSIIVRAHDAIIMSLWPQNVVKSFWRHNDVIFASCVRWELWYYVVILFLQGRSMGREIVVTLREYLPRVLAVWISSHFETRVFYRTQFTFWNKGLLYMNSAVRILKQGYSKGRFYWHLLSNFFQHFGWFIVVKKSSNVINAFVWFFYYY